MNIQIFQNLIHKRQGIILILIITTLHQVIKTITIITIITTAILIIKIIKEETFHINPIRISLTITLLLIQMRKNLFQKLKLT